jgi:integrase
LASKRRATTAEERRRRPAAQRLQNQARDYFIASRPSADLCGRAFAWNVGLSYHTIKSCVPNINALKRTALRNKALDALGDLVSGATFIDQVSARHVSIAIGIRPEQVRRLIRAELSAARATLRRRRKTSTFQVVARTLSDDASVMIEPFFFDGGAVDLAADTWDFMACPMVQRAVSKASIRQDLADVAWVVLRQTLRAGRQTSTMKNLWWGFVRAGRVLDGFVDDLRQAELAAVQAAWYTAERRDSRSMLRTTRTALCRWLEEVLKQPLEPLDARRLARVVGWLRNAPVPRRDDDGTALSTDAFAQLLRLCGDTILAGRAFEWPVDPSSLSAIACLAFNRWSIALAALVSGTAGLRRQSLALIEVDDWGEFQPGHFWLCWKHDKKREEHDAVLDRGVARLLDEYKERTTAVRASLGTRSLFLRVHRGQWVIADPDWIWQGLRLLGERARLSLPECTVALTARLLRRTFATRQAQAGAHIHAIAAQLGHSTTLTTMQYIRYDRLTHAVDVRAALEAGAKLALVPWDSGPRLLAHLPSDERARFLGAEPDRNVGVGLCDAAGCVMLHNGDSIPPCFLCSHLLTGVEFLPEIDDLREATVAEIKVLPPGPPFSSLHANKLYELECIDRLIEGIRGREREADAEQIQPVDLDA